MGWASLLVLWLFVMNLGIAFGAGIYEHRIVVSRWLAQGHWNAEAARQDDTGRRFWAFVSTGPLTILTVVNLVVGWQASGDLRAWWLGAGFTELAARLFTFSFFIPNMIGLMKAEDSPASVARAQRWSRMNYLRHALVLTAWVLALNAFSMCRA